MPNPERCARPLPSLWRGLRLTGFTILALPLAAAAGLVLGALPCRLGTAGAGVSPVSIHVMTNGFHTDIILPTAGEEKDWRPLLRASGLPVGLWTPLAQSLMWSLGSGEAPDR